MFLWMSTNIDSSLLKLTTDGQSTKDQKTFMIWYKRESNNLRTKELSMSNRCSSNRRPIEKDFRPRKDLFVTSIPTM